MDFNSWLDDLTESVRTKQAPKEPSCETCWDTGICMTMVCYGGSPIEKPVYCIDCDQGAGPSGHEISDEERDKYLQALVNG